MTGSDRLVQNPLGPGASRPCHGWRGGFKRVIEMVKQTYSKGLAGEQGCPTVAHDLCPSTLGASACHSDPVMFSGGEEGKIEIERKGELRRHAFFCGVTMSHVASSAG